MPSDEMCCLLKITKTDLAEELRLPGELDLLVAIQGVYNDRNVRWSLV